MPRRRGADGKQSLLETYKREALLGHIRNGNRLQTAARLAGVAPRTAEEWRRRGEGRDTQRPATPLYKQFARDLDEAEAFAEAEAVAAVKAHMPRDYNAAKFWLQTRHPDAWGDKVADQLPPAGALGPVITGGNIILISPERAQIMAADVIAQERIAAGISANTDAIRELAVGPDDDQR